MFYDTIGDGLQYTLALPSTLWTIVHFILNIEMKLLREAISILDDYTAHASLQEAYNYNQIQPYNSSNHE